MIACSILFLGPPLFIFELNDGEPCVRVVSNVSVRITWRAEKDARLGSHRMEGDTHIAALRGYSYRSTSC
jgi:hypothetical protein